jgi:hypothetical protein
MAQKSPFSRIDLNDRPKHQEAGPMAPDQLPNVAHPRHLKVGSKILVGDARLAVDQEQTPSLMMEDGRPGLGRNAPIAGGVGHDAFLPLPGAALTLPRIAMSTHRDGNPQAKTGRSSESPVRAVALDARTPFARAIERGSTLSSRPPLGVAVP